MSDVWFPGSFAQTILVVGYRKEYFEFPCRVTRVEGNHVDGYNFFDEDVVIYRPVYVPYPYLTTKYYREYNPSLAAVQESVVEAELRRAREDMSPVLHQ